MSAPNVSVVLLQRLRDWGVRRVYGYPGDGSNGLNLAFHELGEEVEFVQLRHEELAAFAACAHAKLTGEVGVCMATSGPGAIHLLNGLYDAKLDHAPVLAIVGQQKRMSLGGDFQQEVDLHALFKDVAGEYLADITDPRQTAHVVDRAMRIAQARRTVTAIIVPADVQEMAHEEPPRAHGALYAGQPGYRDPVVRPGDDELWRAAGVLNAGAEGRHPRRPGRPSTPPTRSSRSPSCWAPAWPRRSTGVPSCPTICPSSRARSACSGPSPRPT